MPRPVAKEKRTTPSYCNRHYNGRLFIYTSRQWRKETMWTNGDNGRLDSAKFWRRNVVASSKRDTTPVSYILVFLGTRFSVLLYSTRTHDAWIVGIGNQSFASFSVLAAFYVSGDSNEGMLSASQQFQSGRADIRAYTSEASLVSGEYLLVPYCSLVGNVNAKGSAWLGCDVHPTTLWRMHAKEKQRAQV